MLSKYRVYRYDRMDSPAVTAGTSAVLIGAIPAALVIAGIVIVIRRKRR